MTGRTEIADDEVMEIISAAQRVKPMIFKAFMFVTLREMPRQEYREFMADVYNKRKELGR